jgi:hypothetical protein
MPLLGYLGLIPFGYSTLALYSAAVDCESFVARLNAVPGRFRSSVWTRSFYRDGNFWRAVALALSSA